MKRIGNLINKTGAQALREQTREANGEQLAYEFAEMLDTWHSLPETWDNVLDAEYLQQQADIIRANKYEMFQKMKKYPYFSPSSANSCPRELYAKVRKFKKDVQEKKPYQSRWQKMGTVYGDSIQRDLLFIDKHYEKKVGKTPPFAVQRTEEGYPAWEDFVQKVHTVLYNGQRFSLFGKPDGLLVHTETGQKVGLEIKSKQTTAAQTSLYSMKEAKPDHVKQCVAYSIMYDVDDFIILYGNLSKKGWNMSDEEYEKTPDIRTFHIHVTDEDRLELLNYFASIVDAANKEEPPKLDLERWTFNGFKTAIAESLTDEEYYDIKQQVKRVMKSRIPDWKKRNYFEALEFIDNVREAM